MAHLPRNLPDTLRSHGFRVVVLPGWYGRGVDGSFNPAGVLCHHTASSADGLAGTTILRFGRSDLSGPLSQIGLSRNGTVYLIASGRANHAGTAKSSGTMASGNGNGFYIGIEAMNRGTGERWPKAQYDAYVRLCAVLSVEVTGNSYRTVRAHKETSVTGKIDPFGPTPYEGHFDMGKFRARVRSVMASLSRDGSTSPAWRWNPDVVSELSLVQEQFQIAAGRKVGKIVRYHGVAHIQNALNVKAGENLAVDGVCDKETVAAWKRWEDKHGGTGWSTTPDEQSLRALTILYRFEVDVPTPAPEPAPKPTPAPEPAKTLSIMSWNVESKRDEDLDRAALIKVLADKKPDVICIQEGYRIFLADIPGYREVYRAYKGYSTTSENRAQAILVRDGVSVKRKKAIPMALSWVGPKMGIKKDPRVHRYVTVNKDRQNWRVSTWHVPFGKAPVEETRKAAVSWLKTMGRLGAPAVAVGDWNSLASGLQAKVGTPAGAKVDGGHLDKAVFRGCSKVKGENLGDKNRSDHDIKIWTFKK